MPDFGVEQAMKSSKAMKGIEVIISRAEGTNSEEAVKIYKELMAALKPFQDRGLRVRFAVEESTFDFAISRMRSMVE
jgi:hypothetical protein